MNSFRHRPQRGIARGFTLVEVMIAVVIGMIGILVITQVYLVHEGQKRTTTGGADAQENALMGLFTIEREMRTAGLGVTGLGCSTVNSYNANMPTPNYSFNARPVTIERDTPAAGSDRITLLYGNSSFGSIPTTLTQAAPNANVKFTVANADGFEIGNLVIVSQGSLACTVAEISNTKTQNGGAWDLATTGRTYNPPGGQSNFPPGGYAAGATLTNMGSMINHRYYVQNNNLMMLDVNLPTGATNPVALVSGIIAIRAQYGRDTDGDGFVNVYDNTAPTSTTEVVAVRLAVVARSGQLERTAVSPATLVLWSGGTTANGGAISLNATAQQYRYKTYQTTIPLRNVLWSNN